MTSKKELYHGISSKSPKERAILLWATATILVVGLHVYTYSLIGLPPAQPVGVWQTTVFTVMLIVTSCYGLPIAFLVFFGFVHFTVILTTCYHLLVTSGSIKGWKDAYRQEMKDDGQY